MTARDRYNKLLARMHEEAEANEGEIPYWMENDLAALETECDWESIRAICGSENSREEVE